MISSAFQNRQLVYCTISSSRSTSLKESLRHKGNCIVKLPLGAPRLAAMHIKCLSRCSLSEHNIYQMRCSNFLNYAVHFNLFPENVFNTLASQELTLF